MDDLDKYRILRIRDYKQILERTTADIGKKCSVVQKAQFLEQPLLCEGTGYLLAYYQKRPHAVAIYRCLDGSVIYHDSSLFPVPRFVRGYFYTRGIRRLYKATRQHQTYRTCGYHAFTFLSYAISHSHFGPQELVSSYDRFIGETHAEATVVRCVKKFATEVHPPINIYTTALETARSIVPSENESVTSQKRKADSLDGLATKRSRKI